MVSESQKCLVQFSSSSIVLLSNSPPLWVTACTWDKEGWENASLSAKSRPTYRLSEDVGELGKCWRSLPCLLLKGPLKQHSSLSLSLFLPLCFDWVVLEPAHITRLPGACRSEITHHCFVFPGSAVMLTHFLKTLNPSVSPHSLNNTHVPMNYKEWWGVQGVLYVPQNNDLNGLFDFCLNNKRVNLAGLHIVEDIGLHRQVHVQMLQSCSEWVVRVLE